MKRLLDLLIALLLLPPAIPVVLVAAMAIRLEARGSPFFRQQRVGQDEKLFWMTKLRTMHSGTEHRASHEVGKSRITRIGGLLRKTKIDELPQLFAVVGGTMSLVGPRPCLPVQVELIEERRKRGVFDVKPGITGPAQLSGVDMSTPRRLAEIDSRYVAERSLLGDLEILLATALGRGSGDAVR